MKGLPFRRLERYQNGAGDDAADKGNDSLPKGKEPADPIEKTHLLTQFGSAVSIANLPVFMEALLKLRMRETMERPL
jgi:hypothetical protein